jgi:hypothetical protein
MSGALTWLATSGVIQGVIIGATLAFLTAVVVLDLVARRHTTAVSGWRSLRACGQPGNGVLLRAACSKALPGVNVFEEAAYWTTTVDGDGRSLDGGQPYVLRFGQGQLPPNRAFWSLTVTDVVGYMVGDASDQSSVDDRSALATNPDGSIDLYLQRNAPAGYEQNWLRTPAGRFKLMLRAYLPDAAILDGSYRPPQIARAAV